MSPSSVVRVQLHSFLVVSALILPPQAQAGERTAEVIVPGWVAWNNSPSVSLRTETLDLTSSDGGELRLRVCKNVDNLVQIQELPANKSHTLNLSDVQYIQGIPPDNGAGATYFVVNRQPTLDELYIGHEKACPQPKDSAHSIPIGCRQRYQMEPESHTQMVDPAGVKEQEPVYFAFKLDVKKCAKGNGQEDEIEVVIDRKLTSNNDPLYSYSRLQNPHWLRMYITWLFHSLGIDSVLAASPQEEKPYPYSLTVTGQIGTDQGLKLSFRKLKWQAGYQFNYPKRSSASDLSEDHSDADWTPSHEQVFLMNQPADKKLFLVDDGLTEMAVARFDYATQSFRPLASPDTTIALPNDVGGLALFFIDGYHPLGSAIPPTHGQVSVAPLDIRWQTYWDSRVWEKTHRFGNEKGNGTGKECREYEEIWTLMSALDTGSNSSLTSSECTRTNRKLSLSPLRSPTTDGRLQNTQQAVRMKSEARSLSSPARIKVHSTKLPEQSSQTRVSQHTPSKSPRERPLPEPPRLQSNDKLLIPGSPALGNSGDGYTKMRRETLGHPRGALDFGSDSDIDRSSWPSSSPNSKLNREDSLSISWHKRSGFYHDPLYTEDPAPLRGRRQPTCQLTLNQNWGAETIIRHVINHTTDNVFAPGMGQTPGDMGMAIAMLKRVVGQNRALISALSPPDKKIKKKGSALDQLNQLLGDIDKATGQNQNSLSDLLGQFRSFRARAQKIIPPYPAKGYCWACDHQDLYLDLGVLTFLRGPPL